MRINIPTIILGAACVAFSVALGALMYVLKLPVYLDQPGILLAAILAPGTKGKACLTTVTVALVTFATMGLLISPFSFWFIGTGIASALYGVFVVRGHVTDLIDRTAGPSRFLSKLLLFGVGWGIVAAVVSAPVTIYLFGGVTGAGPTLITAFLVKTGHQIIKAVLLTGFGVEPVDKTLSLFLAIVIARYIPPSFRSHL